MTFSRPRILVPVRHKHTRSCVSRTLSRGCFGLSLAPSFCSLHSFSWLLPHSTLRYILKGHEQDNGFERGKNPGVFLSNCVLQVEDKTLCIVRASNHT